MSTPTIEARWVATGVGFPRMAAFQCAQCGTDDIGWLSEKNAIQDPLCLTCPPGLVLITLNDHGTHELLCRQLAMWAGDDGEAQAYWLARDAYWVIGRAGIYNQRLPRGLRAIVPAETPPTEALARIVEAIGHDHHIRRTLGWEVEPSTLGSMSRDELACCWRFTGKVPVIVGPGIKTETKSWALDDPLLVGIAGPGEARRLIAESL